MTDNTQRYSRLAKRGDVVVVKIPGNEDREAVVRDVDVLIHLADGSDWVVSGDAEIEIVNTSLPDDLAAQVSEMQSEP